MPEIRWHRPAVTPTRLAVMTSACKTATRGQESDDDDDDDNDGSDGDDVVSLQGNGVVHLLKTDGVSTLCLARWRAWEAVSYSA